MSINSKETITEEGLLFQKRKKKTLEWVKIRLNKTDYPSDES